MAHIRIKKSGKKKIYLIKNGRAVNEAELITFFTSKFYGHSQGSNYYQFSGSETYQGNYSCQVSCVKECYIDGDVEVSWSKTSARGSSTIRCLQDSWSVGTTQSGTYNKNYKQKIDVNTNLIQHSISVSSTTTINIYIKIYGDLYYIKG